MNKSHTLTVAHTVTYSFDLFNVLDQIPQILAHVTVYILLCVIVHTLYYSLLYSYGFCGFWQFGENDSLQGCPKWGPSAKCGPETNCWWSSGFLPQMVLFTFIWIIMHKCNVQRWVIFLCETKAKIKFQVLRMQRSSIKVAVNDVFVVCVGKWLALSGPSAINMHHSGFHYIHFSWKTFNKDHWTGYYDYIDTENFYHKWNGIIWLLNNFIISHSVRVFQMQILNPSTVANSS